ncbi:MAG: L-serine ammonia-lyase, iron-sulfur-dependent, subunit alpha [Anaerovoracaceae bacterium]|nr:L-serine ammonia-lyase, iron-sulfur-dependent, subunit alpha [Anaerovoracaceae bacterium]
MHELTKLIYEDMKPALGVTEPGAIAFAVAKARSYTSGELKKISVSMNSGMFKNAFTCGIPGSEKTGALYAAAFGYVAGDADKGLESLAGMTPEDNEKGKKLISEGKVEIRLSGITSRIFIEATVATEDNVSVVTIRDSHTNITDITVYNKAELEAARKTEDDQRIDDYDQKEPKIVTQSIRSFIGSDSGLTIHKYTLEQLIDYADTVDIREIEFIRKAFIMNMDLLHAGYESGKVSFALRLLDQNGGTDISDDEQTTAQLLCSGAIEARVIGTDAPAMSITGSGAHGIIATMPLYAACKVNSYSEERLLRSAALSYLICTYIKEWSGKLSAFCGCGIAAGTGMACALCYLRGGDISAVIRTMNNMAASITGMICDGGNQGCTMKSVAAVDTAYRSVDFAMHGVCIDSAHSIIGKTPELTMRNMGLIAAPGMVGTEKTIVEIFEDKISEQ